MLAAHVFPNITAPLIVHASLISPSPSWRRRRSHSSDSATNRPPRPGARWSAPLTASSRLAPWAAIVPGVAIALAVLGFNLLGDGFGTRWIRAREGCSSEKSSMRVSSFPETEAEFIERAHRMVSCDMATVGGKVDDIDRNQSCWQKHSLTVFQNRGGVR